MSVSFQEVINSKLVNFIVGRDADGHTSEFEIHEKAISQLSGSLSALINQAAESKGSIAWEDVRKDTFERFVQFAYTGDYSIPRPVPRDNLNVKNNSHTNGTSHTRPPTLPNGTRRRNTLVESDNSTDRRLSVSEKFDGEFDLSHENTVPTTKRKNRKKKRVPIQDPEPEPEPELLEDVVIPQDNPLPESGPPVPEPTESEPADSEPETSLVSNIEKARQDVREVPATDFASLVYTISVPRDHYHGSCEPLSEFEKDMSYSDIFLCHASLYILGEKHAVTSLKALALYKLHKTLCIFQLHRENALDVTDLARYAYSDNHMGSEGNGGIKGLVCHYMAAHARELSEDTTFMNLLAGGGQIVKDFVKLQLIVK